MARSLVFEATYPYAIEDVWTAVTDPQAIEDWLMPNDFRPEEGHRFQFRTKPAPGFDGIVHCEVVRVAPPNELSYSWKGGGVDTVVSILLTSRQGGTHLRLEQSGFKGLRAWMVSQILGRGWKRIIGERIPAAAARVRNGLYQPDRQSPSSQCDQ